MKRKIIYSFIFAVAAMLAGCGSNSKDNPIGGGYDGPYSFFNATTPLIITQSGVSSGTCSSGTCSSGTCSGGTCPLAEADEEDSDTVETKSINISVQLLKNGLAEPGQTVQMRPFDYKYGQVVNMVVATNGNGNAVFEYIAPEGSDYNAIIGQDITIQAIFFAPPEDGEEVDEDENPEVTLAQDFVLQFR